MDSVGGFAAPLSKLHLAVACDSRVVSFRPRRVGSRQGFCAIVLRERVGKIGCAANLRRGGNPDISQLRGPADLGGRIVLHPLV